MASTNRTTMETPIEGLYAAPPAPLSFAPTTHVRAFLLRRDRGNVIVYNAPGLASVTGEIRALGGIARHVVNHRHEAMFGPQGTDVGVFVHERDREATAQSLSIEGTFSERHMLDDDFEVIPTPGHTPGATAFLWDGGAHRFLFTGDSLYLTDGDWRVAVLDSSDRAAYLESLALLRDLEFDVLVPWAATAGRPYVAVTSHAETQRRIDAIIERVKRGENR
ncbi:MAG: MBL fold metallo-hydrolase [Solirubrobacteraceae bacterium]